MKREYYSDSIGNFLNADINEILGELTKNNDFDLTQTQRNAWIEEISILKKTLSGYKGKIYFEYSIPRMGKRIDVLLLIGPTIIILEFKVGEKLFDRQSLDQVCDYSLDLRNFHETSHESFIAPILVATKATYIRQTLSLTPKDDKLFNTIGCGEKTLRNVIQSILDLSDGDNIDSNKWEAGRYCPTPTIVEAAKALYKGHSVGDISRSDATAINLSNTSDETSKIINYSKKNGRKSICFVTGVPGSGKTLVGLNIANMHSNRSDKEYSVFLSGNGPLVSILREALARDKVEHEKQLGRKMKKGEAMGIVKEFIQNVHHFRDDCLIDKDQPPIEHVVLFDEAQRAWNVDKTSDFMKRKKGQPGFTQSEPEFLISCLDRHEDWAVIVCLVGGGQEINTGEAGISEWVESLNRSFPNWDVYISSKLTDSEYGAGKVIEDLKKHPNINIKDDLHLSVSMRSFRTENVSLLVKQVLDMDVDDAKITLSKIKEKYSIVITRDVSKAKKWLKEQARGSERYGIIVSSQAERLKPYAIDVKSPIDPIHWFLDGKDDVRSSYYLEDIATEFHVQGLELDWVCVTWDADFRYTENGWDHKSFHGKRWKNINKEERKNYLKNAYRVLLTRARQGMVIVVPSGDSEDLTRNPEFYDPIFGYLKNIGFTEI